MSDLLTRFDDVLGQDSAIATITQAYRNDRLPHGLIFSGPEGVGKETTARALGSLVLCEKPKGLSPCGKCASCVAFAAGNHPDYHVVYRQLARIESEKLKAKALSVDVIRDYLIAPAAMKSTVGVGKFFVVREADLMMTAAQNAMLKTLEEPAGRTVIVLLTDSPDLLLPTIRSRSQLVRFAPLSEALVRDELTRRGLSRDAAADAARYSDGSLGLALQWHEDGVIQNIGQLVAMLEKFISGQPADGLQEWFKKAADAYAEKQLERDPNGSKDTATREGLVLYLKQAAQYFRRRLLVVRDDPEAMERMCEAIDAVVRAEGYLESNVNTSLVFQQFAGALRQILSVPAAAGGNARS